jgi:hypothetical protein
MIRPEGVRRGSARRPPRALIGPVARAYPPSGSSSPCEDRSFGCGGGWLTGEIRKPLAIQREYGRFFGVPRARDMARPLATGGCRPDGRR